MLFEYCQLFANYALIEKKKNKLILEEITL